MAKFINYEFEVIKDGLQIGHQVVVKSLFGVIEDWIQV